MPEGRGAGTGFSAGDWVGWRAVLLRETVDFWVDAVPV